ncbi:MAG: helix-turn-helix transcriptional regulator [Bacilli bacterium]|nr:helix-turn-helix transcriptional regulator [Bacilli bacterium]MBQ7030968.1 helix-turn-helix transcriptional regulator [Bacilli bacterium]MBQ7141218.1 helix-turn-helix transcriptional regulator [Bacilli bacterium]
MDIGNRIKKYREINGLSQEELADRIFVSRPTISNWETNKFYPDIQSICMLCNVFAVSLDDFIKGDVEKMKKIISEKEMNNYNRISVLFTIEIMIVLFSAYPLINFLRIPGVIIWSVLLIIGLIMSHKIEKIHQKYDIRTYKEIVAFTEQRSLSKDEIIEEKAKRPYQKVLLLILSGLIAILVYVMLELLIG